MTSSLRKKSAHAHVRLFFTQKTPPVTAASSPQAEEILRSTVIEGDATNPDVLAQADPKQADILAALTGKGPTNFAVCAEAKHLGDEIRTIARIDQPDGIDTEEKNSTEMELRLEWAALAMKESANVSALCRRFGISQTTGYRWIRHCKAEGKEGLRDRTRKPRNSPNKTPTVLKKRFVQCADTDVRSMFISSTPIGMCYRHRAVSV